MSNTIIKINGLDIKSNSLYKIVDKPDNNALDGLINYGSTKVPQEYMGTLTQCPWDKVSNTFDTGFYTYSPCYNGQDQNSRTQMVALLQKHIVEPYERVYGLGTLDNKNLTFWESYNVDLEEGRIFNTANIKDLLDLYIAMRGFELTPKSMVGDPRFKTSQFFIEDREITNSKRNEREKNRMDALENFFIMLASEKSKLISALKYINMNGSASFNSETEASSIKAIFSTWIDQSPTNVDSFLRVTEMVSKEAGLREVSLYSILLVMQQQNKIQKIGEEYSYDGVLLGADLKTVAKNLSTKRNLKSLRDKIFQEDSIDPLENPLD